jgi:CheY-like chemotaxis protein/transcriptional regulator with XRE-family HTH domain
MDTTKTGQDMPARDDLVPSLRFALKHLYDPVVLPQSPLIPLLGLSDVTEPVSQLRQTLVRAIRSLQPEAGIPADTQVWRVYEILLYRYVQRLSQLEVADQLGVSIRHLGRLERQALQVLAERLRQHLRIPAGDVAACAGRAEQSSLISNELPWLAEAGAGEVVHLEPILSSVLELVQPMARQHGVTLDLSIFPDLLPLAVHPVALRQILLSLLGAAIRQAPGQRVLIAARTLEWEVEVQVRAPRAGEARTVESDEAIAASLEMAARLAATCGGGVTTGADGQAPVVTATLPASEQTPVLVIDDNVNTLRLLQRYSSSTRYRVIPAATLPEGLALARETTPCVIVLDVMMPEVDGWEVLGRLRQHPLTGHIPVVVCTILAEEELALSLGASGFVRKPVSREAFLDALDRVYLAARGSH